MEIPEFHQNFFLCGNAQLFPEESYILHLGYPKFFIRFSGEITDFNDYHDFEESIFQIDWIDEIPAEDEMDALFFAAYGFLIIEHIALFEILEELEDEDETE